ncbi:threonine--tRNA ligase [Candidatus Dojkabacteria bacterium]|uniref:Threonine--tRNA ligase n=1 Tax=Candidatus Dojkabacteria bacterium TaxID=2099670 RepID=A0A955L9X3_9BACT|nr:threonine--tRNA ligase [Candidatus Dojkabacteria bacterium]
MDSFQDFKSIVPNWVNENNFELYKTRHTAEHVLHLAMTELFPEIKRAMGPPTEEGFYFDFDPGKVKISEEDIPRIEKKMKEIQKMKLPLIREDISVADAKKLFADNPYKLEWIEEYADQGKNLTVYWTGNPGDENADPDLCKGPHIESTKNIGYFKLLSIAGAYWRGDEKNKMLTRIYGTTFKSKQELESYLWQIEEAKKRDHRKLGKQLDLFSFSDLIGGGLPLFSPRGTIVRNELIGFVREMQEKRGYQAVDIPHITKKELYETSGHWDLYKDDLFHVKGFTDDHFCLKPMNCPHHTQIFASQPRSYRDLPIKYYEATKVYRDEQSGELHGLSRVRAITQDDAHVFCTPEQIEEEVIAMLEIFKEFYEVMGMETKVRLSVRDPQNKEKYLGDDSVWEKSEAILKSAMQAIDKQFYIGEGEAAFYGPKLDYMAIDSLGREWQLATAQLDMNMPERFQLEYVDSNGEKQRPVMLHRAVNGSIERFMSIAIEHFGGAFPTWLSPDQVVIIPISDNQNEYAEKLTSELVGHGVRAKTDSRSETMQSKIRSAQEWKIPYMLIVGEREENEKTVSIRFRNEKKNEVMKFDTFLTSLVDKIQNRALELKF